MILVTGGTGYIGSHTCVSLAKAGFDYVVLDNLSNSSIDVLDRVNSITGHAAKFIEGDVNDLSTLLDVFSNYSIDAVIHFAAFKSVAASIIDPLGYYQNNITGCLTLLAAMKKMRVNTLVFSSSATVYAPKDSMPLTEQDKLGAANPYGWTKLMMEQVLSDLYSSDPDRWRIACLRYFNPVGAHPSGLIGENPKGIPTNLMPYISQVAAGIRTHLNIWGNDYPTKDGTGVRDFIHVLDLAEGHVAALHYLKSHNDILTLNLGTGRGTSVLEMISAFEKVSGCEIPHQFGPRRAGDVAACWADPSAAADKLKWTATRSITEMCRDTWLSQARA